MDYDDFMSDTKNIIQGHIGALLEYSVLKNIQAITISKVIGILLEIDDSVREIVIDGDELMKYFNKKS